MHLLMHEKAVPVCVACAARLERPLLGWVSTTLSGRGRPQPLTRRVAQSLDGTYTSQYMHLLMHEKAVPVYLCRTVT